MSSRIKMGEEKMKKKRKKKRKKEGLHTHTLLAVNTTLDRVEGFLRTFRIKRSQRGIGLSLFPTKYLASQF